MHKISSKSIQAAQRHAQELLGYGISVEDFGKKLRSRKHYKQEIGQSIEKFGETIQNLALESLYKAQELEGECSVENFSDSVYAHIYASRNHIEAVKTFQKGSQTHSR